MSASSAARSTTPRSTRARSSSVRSNSRPRLDPGAQPPLGRSHPVKGRHRRDPGHQESGSTAWRDPARPSDHRPQSPCQPARIGPDLKIAAGHAGRRAPRTNRSERKGRTSKMADEAQDANAVVRRYWNTVAGPRWAAAPEARERRNRESLAMLLDRLHLAPGEQVLEIGCGTGALTLPLAAAVGAQGP